MFRRFAGLSHAHFLGIGGAGMSGIAEVPLNYDLKVSGCDRARSMVTDRLESLGAEIHQGHSPTHLDGVDLVVKSSAIGEDNPEIIAAREQGITVVRRAEMLAELMRLKYGIAVAGTHGKTTTTSLVGHVLTELELDPTVIVGGRMRVSGTGARIGKSEFLVAEADEFDRSFLRLMPILAVITNIDVDHLDTYADLDAIREAFVTFADRVPFFGQIILCLDNVDNQRILPRLTRDHRVLTYGLTPQAELSVGSLVTRGNVSRFSVFLAGQGELGEIELPMPGKHNVQNALAAVAVGLALGLDFSNIARAMRSFGGVHRRFEALGHWRGAAVIDDDAHHPTEVEATLQAAREAFPEGKVFAVFQPHLFSRTRDLMDDFGRALMGADRAIVTDIYASREQPIEGVEGKGVAVAARENGHRHARFCGDWRQVPELLSDIGPEDVLLTMGAGDIYRLGLLNCEEES